MSREEIIKAYRSLYRSGLRAVQFSKPARYQLRDQLRDAFRSKVEPPSAAIVVPSPASAATTARFDPERIRRTVWFLNAAAESRGLEHKIVKNLLHTHFWRRRNAWQSWDKIVKLAPKKKYVCPLPRLCGVCHVGGDALADRGCLLVYRDPAELEAYKHYDATIAMLNESMGLCLR